MSVFLLVALSAAAELSDYSAFRPSEAELLRITSAEYRRCLNKALHNEEAVQCIRDEWLNIDRQLNASYRLALARMPNGRARQELRASQRQWLINEPETCSEENAGGHTPYELAIHQCQIDERISRTAWLRRLSRR